jgi:phosphate:Na+ symporter
MNELAVVDITMGLLGGLALFLFGMDQMSNALKAAAGSGMSNVLATLTRNRFMAAGTGAFVTAVIQSSSVTTVLVVGFTSAGLMSLQQSIGIILGAEVGTTMTAQIIAFKVTHYALLLVAVGFGILFLSPREKIRQYGGMLMGLGLIFFGMGLMSDATSPLRQYQPFIDLMESINNPLLGIAIAAVFTALVQSSSATIGIIIVLASQGFITLEAGIALVFGANIGTCVTVLLAAIGKPAAAKQAAAVHLVFNVFGVIMWIPFIAFLATAVDSISPVYGNLQGAERLAAETPRQIANAHTIFNVTNVLIFIGFTAPLARLLKRLIPETPEVVPEVALPKYLDEGFFKAPSLALDALRREGVRLGTYIANLISEGRIAVIGGGEADLDAIVARGKELRRLHQSITEYAGRLTTMRLTSAETRRLTAINIVISNLQHVSDTIAINLVSIGRERIEQGLTFDETITYFQPYIAKMREGFDLALQSLDEQNVDLARRVVEMEPEIKKLADETVEYIGRHLIADDPKRAVLYRVEDQSVELLHRIYYFAHKIAKEILWEAEADEVDPVGAGQSIAET